MTDIPAILAAADRLDVLAAVIEATGRDTALRPTAALLRAVHAAHPADCYAAGTSRCGEALAALALATAVIEETT